MFFLKKLKLKISLPFLKDYKIIKKLGEGTYGCSYLLEDKNFKKYVFKHLKKKISKKVGSKIKYEMSILNQLNHPNISKLLYIINQNGVAFSRSDIEKVDTPLGYIMEYIKGKTLASLLYDEKYCFSNQETWKIVQQLMSIVVYLQEKKIIHRDIRTPNVIISEDNEIYLLDFGLARPMSNEENYQYDIDFTYLADFLLYLLYSNFNINNKSDKPWYEELDLLPIEKCTIKKMFGIEGIYKDVYELQNDINKINQIM